MNVDASACEYRATRNAVRAMIGQSRFVEVFVNTQVGGQRRDEKRICMKARRGAIKGFTGIDDPY